MYKFLDGVNSPQDIKKLNRKQLEELAKEIRIFLVKNISETGGHLASNLGVVELTLAIHKVFNSPNDKFIWDVGHQSYVHKIITGRKDMFKTLRQYNGLSGFPKESESEHDIFDTGHSSTSISAALGIAAARDIRMGKYKIISIIGDGAMTGGMAFEALNNLGYLKKDIIIIFNDNEMSIDKNTGALSNSMSKIMRNADTLALKKNIDKIMNMTQVGGKISRKANKLTDSILTGISPAECGLIDSLGIKYFGPINGHNISELIDIFEYIKCIDGPKFIHVKTIKGKGYKYAQNFPENYHGVGKFDYKIGVKPSEKKSISSIVGSTLSEMANYNENIVAITAAMSIGTGLNIFERFHPNRYFDVGISEQHAVTFAAGLAKAGMKPYFCVYSTFLQRGYDQLIHDVCITKKPVTFLIDRAGLVGNDGETHHGEFDLSYLNPIPNIIVMAPKDTPEMIKMIKFSERLEKPVAIRYPRGNGYYFDIRDYSLSSINNFKYDIEQDSFDIYNVGKPEIIFDNLRNDSVKILLITVGNMIIQGIKAADNILKSRDDVSFKVVNARFVKPLDEDSYKKLIKEVDYIFTIEDNVRIGGFGSNVEHIINSNNIKKNICTLGLPDNFITHGDVDILYEEVGLSSSKIKDKIERVLLDRGF